MIIHHQEVRGIQIDKHSRCSHYASLQDVIAIKFKCCGCYYACFSCHLELADHPAERWHSDEFHTKAVLCGRCGYEMTIHEYMHGNSTCLKCRSQFNPNCKLHWELYFERNR